MPTCLLKRFFTREKLLLYVILNLLKVLQLLSEFILPGLYVAHIVLIRNVLSQPLIIAGMVLKI